MLRDGHERTNKELDQSLDTMMSRCLYSLIMLCMVWPTTIFKKKLCAKFSFPSDARLILPARESMALEYSPADPTPVSRKLQSFPMR